MRLLGRVSTEDLVTLYHLATALVFPSQHEAWSIPIMEAMACGCPVASSNVTSLPEELGDAGLLFAAATLRECRMRFINSQPTKSYARRWRSGARTRESSLGRIRSCWTVTSAYEFARSKHRTRKAA